MRDEALRITVARQLAALRRQGWTTPQAVAFVAPALDAGPVRDALQRADERLRSTLAPGGDDVLEALVSRGDAASAQALDCLADAWEAGEAARRALRSVALLLGTATLGPLLLATVFGWLGLDLFFAAQARTALPGTTRLMLFVVGLAKWGGLPVAAVLGALLWRGAGKAQGGGRESDTAATLLQLAAALESGQAEGEAVRLLRPAQATGSLEAALGLSPAETRYLAWRRTSAPLSAAVRELAEEALALAEEKRRRFERYVPIVLTWAVVVLLGAVMGLLMVPLFQVAGSMQ